MSQSFYGSVIHDNRHLFDEAHKWQFKLRAEKRKDWKKRGADSVHDDEDAD